MTLPPEIWRAVTAFLVSGPKLSILMDPYFCIYFSSMSFLLLLMLTLSSVHVWIRPGEELAKIQSDG